MFLTAPKVYYESYAFTVRYDQELSLGWALWRGKLTGAELQEAFLICAHVVDKYKLTRWLADDRKMKAYPEEDKLWIFENIVPSLIASPLRRMAVLPSEDLQQVEAVEFYVERSADKGDMIMKDFLDEEEALQWLMQEF